MSADDGSPLGSPRYYARHHSADDPADWSEVRGHVTETVGGDEARRHIDDLARKYMDTQFPGPVGPRGRVILKVTPSKINTARTMRS
jgi:hypothetical protein